MAGDLNFADIKWFDPDLNGETMCQSLFCNIITEHQLTQIILQPMRGSTTLHLVFISESFHDNDVMCLPPFANSDHDSLMPCI